MYLQDKTAKKISTSRAYLGTLPTTMSPTSCGSNDNRFLTSVRVPHKSSSELVSLSPPFFARQKGVRRPVQVPRSMSTTLIAQPDQNVFPPRVITTSCGSLLSIVLSCFALAEDENARRMGNIPKFRLTLTLTMGSHTSLRQRGRRVYRRLRGLVLYHRSSISHGPLTCKLGPPCMY
jgi:hypothetical protein